MDYEFSVSYTVSNIIAIATAVMAMRWPMSARVLLGTLFIGASVLNTYVALTNPALYLGYSELTNSDTYRSFILGSFSEHTQLYVLLIAAGQLLIGVFTCYTGPLMKLAMTGGIIFLLAIAPLGVGSAFPSTVIIAVAFFILLRKKQTSTCISSSG